MKPIPLTNGQQIEIPELNEEERNMTVEQWVRYEIERQVQALKRDGEAKIKEFQRKCEEARKRIEAL